MGWISMSERDLKRIEILKGEYQKRGRQIYGPDYVPKIPAKAVVVAEPPQADRTVCLPSNRASFSGQICPAILLFSDVHYGSAANLCVVLAIAFFRKHSSASKF
jgi:hypothetical protein